MSVLATAPAAPPRTEPSVGSDLQATLLELLDLALVGKQAHWNIVGPNFRSLHLQLDEIVDVARAAADRVAERMAAIGVAPDGRAATVAESSAFGAFPAGTVRVEDAVEQIGSGLDLAASRLRDRVERVGDADLISQGVLIEIGAELEKQAWMVRAQRTPTGGDVQRP